LEDVGDVLRAATKYCVQAGIEALKNRLRSWVKKYPIRVYAIACRNGLKSVALDAANEAVNDLYFFVKPCPELKMIPADVYWNLIAYYRNLQFVPFYQLKWRDVSILDNPPPQHRPKDSWASWSFNNKNADVILRSADRVHFRLHKLILEQSSPIFRDIFKLLQPDVEGNTVPIVPVSESSKTLDCLFRIVYPVGTCPKRIDLVTIERALDAAVKYKMHRPQETLKDALIDHISKTPTSVFLIACKHRFPVIARAAAEYFLRQPLLRKNKKLREETEGYIVRNIDVPASVLQRLVKYWFNYLLEIDTMVIWDNLISHWEESETIRKVTNTLCLTKPCGFPRIESMRGNLGSIANIPRPSWLNEYLENGRVALKFHARGGTSDDQAAFRQALDTAIECKTCSVNAFAALQACRKFLILKNTQVLSEVWILSLFLFLQTIWVSSFLFTQDIHRHVDFKQLENIPNIYDAS
jgi:hypothetical protein